MLSTFSQPGCPVHYRVKCASVLLHALRGTSQVKMHKRVGSDLPAGMPQERSLLNKKA
jgi:hypothetical protein